jgi:4-hydroxybenzoate polyprenyltransferase
MKAPGRPKAQSRITKTIIQTAIVVLALLAVGLMSLLPPESLKTALVYKGF